MEEKKVNKLLSSIQREEAVPKAYALLISVGKARFLWLEAAFSLEEAFLSAKDRLSRLHPNTDFNVAKIELFNHEDLETLLNRSKDFKLVTSATTHSAPTVFKVGLKPTDKDISILMKNIIDSKDWKLLEESRSVLSPAQIQFLEDKLNKKKKKI